MSFSLPGKGIRLVQALRSRAFAWFWLGQTISVLGDGAFLTALAVAVYALTGSSLMMGLFLTAQITPELVESDHLASANALTALSVQCGKLIGPVLGATFIVVGGGSAALAFAFDGLTFLISVCSLFAISRLTFPITQTASQQERSSMGIKSVAVDMLDGFRTIRASTWLFWSMIGATFGVVAYMGAITVSLPKLVFAVYRSNTWLLAAVSTAVGIGAIAGAVVVGQFHLRHRGMIGFAAYIASGLALMAFSLPLSAASIPFVILPAAFVAGLGMSMMDMIWSTLLYELVPSHKLGRVASVDHLGSLCLLPLGYVFAGWISDIQGPAMVFLFGGLIMVLLNTFPLFLRDIRTLQ